MQITKTDEDYYFFALKRNKDIGHLLLSFSTDYCNLSGWWIHGLFVNRFYRHLNVGTKLIENVIEFVNKTNPMGIYVYVIKDYLDIISFYERLGFQEIKTEASASDDRFIFMQKKI